MLLGPVFEFEVLATGRRSRYIWLRVIISSFLLFFLSLSYLESSGYNSGQLDIQQGARLAEYFFLFYASTSLLAILLIVPTITAGMISTERERRTIEYLFATDLSNTEIILPKLIARLLLILKLMLVGIPILAIFGLLGGIQIEKLFTSFILNLSTAVLVATASLCVSVWSTRAREAIIRAFLLLILFLITPILAALFRFNQLSNSILIFVGDLLQPSLDFLVSINPLYVGLAQFQNGLPLLNTSPTTMFWNLVLRQFIFSAGFILLSIAAVRRVHLQGIGKSSSERFSWIKKFNPFFLKKKRPQIGLSHPMIWKECYSKSETTKLGILGRGVIFLLLSMYGVAVSMFFYHMVSYRASSYYSSDDYYLSEFHEFTGVMSAIYLSVLLLLVTARSANQITSEKEQDTWLTLVSTSLSANEILFSKALGNIYSFRWLLLFLWIPHLVFILHVPTVMLIGLLQILQGAIFLWYATMLGHYYSLRCKTSLRAMSWSLGMLLFTGGCYFITCCVPVFEPLRIGSSSVVATLFLAPCIPFIFATPQMLAGNYSWSSSDESFLLASFVGTILYGAIGYGLYNANKRLLESSRFSSN